MTGTVRASRLAPGRWAACREVVSFGKVECLVRTANKRVGWLECAVEEVGEWALSFDSAEKAVGAGSKVTT